MSCSATAYKRALEVLLRLHNFCGHFLHQRTLIAAENLKSFFKLV